jgi:hypothetical protein
LHTGTTAWPICKSLVSAFHPNRTIKAGHSICYAQRNRGGLMNSDFIAGLIVGIVIGVVLLWISRQRRRPDA